MSKIFFTPLRLPLLLGGYRDVMAIFKIEGQKHLRIGTALKFADKEYKVTIAEPVTANDLRAIADKLEGV